MLNLNHLYYFHVFIQEGNVSVAAKKLGITQPALSNQLKTFETSIGKPLVDRHGKKISLTQAGKKVFEHAEEMFQVFSRLSITLKNEDSSLSAIRLGACLQVAASFPLDLVRRIKIREVKPGVPRFKVVCEPIERIVKQLRDEEVDVVLVDEPIQGEMYRIEAHVSTPVFLFMEKQRFEELSADQKKALREASAEKMLEVLRTSSTGLLLPEEHSPFRASTEEFFEKFRYRPRVALEANAVSILLRALELGIGALFLPTAFTLNEVQMGKLEVLGPEGGFWQHDLWVISKKTGNRTAVVREVSSALKSRFPEAA